MTHPTSDIDADLRPLEDYAIVAVLGCGLLVLAPVLLACVVWALVAWL